MIKTITIALAALHGSAHGQLKAANFATGTPGTDQYEHFTFWTDGGRRSRIEYSYGTDRKTLSLVYAGPAANGSGFRVLFPNKLVLTLVPAGNRLLATGKDHYRKYFAWAYEGPVNGIGTYCTPCTQDARAAMQLVRTSYLR